MGASRRNGKVDKSEWPAIAARAKVEPLAQIARDYGCTAPNIRYIAREHARKAPLAEEQAVAADVLVQLGRRFTSDMASFIVAVDGADPGSLESLERLRDATDEVMRCAARLLIEIERAEGQHAPARPTR